MAKGQLSHSADIPNPVKNISACNPRRARSSSLVRSVRSEISNKNPTSITGQFTYLNDSGWPKNDIVHDETMSFDRESVPLQDGLGPGHLTKELNQPSLLDRGTSFSARPTTQTWALHWSIQRREAELINSVHHFHSSYPEPRSSIDRRFGSSYRQQYLT